MSDETPRADAALLLWRLQREGVRVWVEGDRLRVHPLSHVSQDDLDELRFLSAELADRIERPAVCSGGADRRRLLMSDEGDPLCPDCGGVVSSDGLRRCPVCQAEEEVA